MSDAFSDDESVSADMLQAAIEDIQDRQNQRFSRNSFFRVIGLCSAPIELSPEEDASGLGGFITAPALFGDSLVDRNLSETDVQALRKDWIAVGNDLRIAILSYRLESVSQVTRQ